MFIRANYGRKGIWFTFMKLSSDAKLGAREPTQVCCVLCQGAVALLVAAACALEHLQEWSFQDERVQCSPLQHW